MLSLLSCQVPCWLRPRDRTRSPDILSNMSRPTTLPLRIPPRISITQADTDGYPIIKHITKYTLFFNLNLFCIFLLILAVKQKMAYLQLTPLLAPRVRAERCTPPCLRARGENHSSTDLTLTMTCPPKPSPVILPLLVKGELKQKQIRDCTVLRCSVFIHILTVSPYKRHTAEDFIVTPFAQVSLTKYERS